MTDLKEIDLKQLIIILWQKAVIIILATVISGVAAFVYTNFGITPIYSASVTMYVNNNYAAQQDNPITSSDLNVSRSLVDTCVTIIQSRNILEKVSDRLDAGLNTSQLLSMMTAGSVGNTEIFSVSIENADPELAAEIANTIAEVAPDAIEEIVVASSIKIIDYASIPSAPISPNVTRNTVLGMLIGLFLSIIIIFLAKLFDVRIRTEEDLEDMFDLPVLGVIPSFEQAQKTGSSYGYGASYKRRKLV